MMIFLNDSFFFFLLYEGHIKTVLETFIMPLLFI